MSNIDLGFDKLIGRNCKCFIIAEIGQNHQGDINLAQKMILEAKNAGADCVKFQKSCITEKFTKTRLSKKYEGCNSWGKTYGEHKEYLEFSDSEFIQLKEFAERNHVLFSSSAMDMVSAEFLCKMKLPFIKIGSGDSNNLPLIEYLASQHIPLVVSTGMINHSQVVKIYNAIKQYHLKFSLLHCVSSYPTPSEDCNLNVIRNYQESFEDIPIGYSGHETGITATIAAVALGAKVIERHFTLDKTLKGSDHSCSLTPTEFSTMVKQIRETESALGSPLKSVAPSEWPCIEKLQKSLVASKDLKKGLVLCGEDVKIKVSEPKGINGIFYHQIIGQAICCDKLADDPFLQEEFTIEFIEK